jgi:SAM-dependent methyltransferase
MHNRHQDKELYFREQIYTTENYVIPFIERHMPVGSDTEVMEVGCGEGGNMKPFLDKGCKVTGVDISPSKIEYAQQFLGQAGYGTRLSLVADDVYNLEARFAGRYDLIILRDVIEHIHNQERFMGFIKAFLKPGGMIFFGFPPWYNPFGGHQQICENRILSKLPYFHLLPTSLYRSILKAGGESRLKIDALLEIKETGISIERFEIILRKENYSIQDKLLYFINPNYEIKFRVKPRKQVGLICAIPFLRDYLTTSVYYIVKKKNNK